MAFFTNITILLVLACICHQQMLGSCSRGNGRRGRGVDRGQNKSGLKAGRPSKAASAQPVKGKLVTKDKSECTWAATGHDVLVLGVTCKKNDRSFACEFIAKPSLCPQYGSDVKLYWKQIARALQKQRNLCQDRSAVIRAGMCRRAARDAHFRFHNAQTTTKKKKKKKTAQPDTPPPPPKTDKSCQPANKKLAEEYCNESWSSFCTFFFTMVQDYDC